MVIINGIKTYFYTELDDPREIVAAIDDFYEDLKPSFKSLVMAIDYETAQTVNENLEIYVNRVLSRVRSEHEPEPANIVITLLGFPHEAGEKDRDWVVSMYY